MPAILTKLFNRLRLLEDYDDLQLLFNDPFGVSVSIINAFVVNHTGKKSYEELEQLFTNYSTLKVSDSKPTVKKLKGRLFYTTKFKIYENLKVSNLNSVLNFIKSVNAVTGVTSITMNHANSDYTNEMPDLNNLVISFNFKHVTDFQLFKFFTLVFTDPKLMRLISTSKLDDLNWGAVISDNRLHGSSYMYLNHLLSKIDSNSLRKIETFSEQDRKYIIKNFFDTLVDNNILTNHFSANLRNKNIVFVAPKDYCKVDMDLHKDLSEFEFCLEYIETCINTLNNIFSGRTKNSTWEKYSKYCEILVPNKDKFEDAIKLRKDVHEIIDNFFNENPIVTGHLYKKIEDRVAIFGAMDINSVIENKDVSVSQVKNVLSDNLKNELAHRIRSKIKSPLITTTTSAPPASLFYISNLDNKVNDYFSRENITDIIYYIALRKIFDRTINYVYWHINGLNKDIDCSKIKNEETIEKYKIDLSDYIEFIQECSTILGQLNTSVTSKGFNFNDLIRNLNSLENKDFIKDFISKKESGGSLKSSMSDDFKNTPAKTIVENIYKTLLFMREQLLLMLQSTQETVVTYCDIYKINQESMVELNKFINIFKSLANN
jgi:hypothetical protein